MTKLYSNGGAKPKEGVDKSGESDIINKKAEQRQEFIRELKGTKAIDGTVISGVSAHAADRMIERKVSADSVKNTLRYPTSSYPGNQPNTNCVQKDGLRIVYSSNGNIISAIKL